MKLKSLMKIGNMPVIKQVPIQYVRSLKENEIENSEFVR